MKNNRLFYSIIFICFITFVNNLYAGKYSNIERNKKIMSKIESSGTKYESKLSILWVQKNYLTKDQALNLQHRIDQGIVEVENYLGITFNSKVYGTNKITYFVYGAREASHSITGYEPRKYMYPIIFLTWASEKRAPYLHETVHILAWDWYSVWIKEGLAVYLNDKLGGYPAFPNFGKNLDLLAKQYLIHKKILDKVGENGIIKFSGIKEKRIFYTLSGSFTKYIFENIGSKEFMKIYDSKDTKNAVLNVTGKNISFWKEKWIKYLNKYTER